MIQRNQVYLASFPFGDKAGMKLRTVLTLTGQIGSIPEVLVGYISSVVPNPLLPSDVVLDPATEAHATTNHKTQLCDDSTNWRQSTAAASSDDSEI